MGMCVAVLTFGCFQCTDEVEDLMVLLHARSQNDCQCTIRGLRTLVQLNPHVLHAVNTHTHV